MAILALEIGASCRHMSVVCCVSRISVGQGKITTLISIAATGLRMALEAVCPNRLVDRLDGLIYGHWGHSDIIWHKHAVDFFPLVSCLVTYEAINVLELGL
jgi:hypothetical protein